MLKKRIFSSVCLAALLAVCGCSSDNNDNSGSGGSAGSGAITTPSATGNIQAQIGSVSINSPPVVTFSLSDENGKPLNPVDMLKANSSNRLRFYIARLDDKGRYLNYIKNASGSAPSYDGNEKAADIPTRIAEVSPGVYSYTFATDIKDSTKTFQHFSSASMLGKKATTFDAAKTHTVVAQILRKGTKNGKAFDQVANPYMNFRPDGGAVTATREITPISGCNKCHGVLALHGGSRVDVALCIVCHTAGVTTDGTKNTASIDMKEMVHNIHMGKAMPDKAYFKTSAFKAFSTVTYPVFSRDSVINTKPVDCAKCHAAGTDAAGKSYGKDVAKYLVASAENCNSCHNTTAYQGETTLTVSGVAGVTAKAHSGGTVSSCGCHAASGSAYDNSVPGSHTVWEKASTNPGIVAKALYATNVAPGKYPRVYFQVTDAKGKAIDIDAGTVTPNVTNANSTLLFKNAISIHMAIKPKNIPDFLNAKISGEEATNRFPVVGGGGSTATVNISQMKYLGRVTTVDAGKGIHFVNYSNAATVGTTITAPATVPTVTEVPQSLPKLTGDYLNGATIALALQATRSDTSITHRGVTTVIGTSATTKSPLNPATEAVFNPSLYIDLATGGPVADDQLRRKVIDPAKCANCHNILTAHGGRPNGDSCVLCHNPNRNDENFAFLIHKYHTGELQAPNKFRRYAESKGIAYPNNTIRCGACHINDNPQPVSSYPAYTTFNSFDANNRIPSNSAYCISCHDTAASPTAPLAHVKGQVSGFSFVAPTLGSPASWGGTVEMCTGCHSDSSRKLVHQPGN